MILVDNLLKLENRRFFEFDFVRYISISRKCTAGDFNLTLSGEVMTLYCQTSVIRGDLRPENAASRVRFDSLINQK